MNTSLLRVVLVAACFMLINTFLRAQSGVLGKADSLFMKANFKSALPLYETALKENPKNALVWSRFGFCNHQLGKKEQAIAAYTTAHQNNPGPQLKQSIESRMARVYSLMNEKDKAFDWLEKAIQSGYSNSTELITNEDYANLRSDARYVRYHKDMYALSYPCSTEPKRRQFDFWIGEWEVFNLAGVQVGSSRVQNVSGECMILENWTSTSGPYTGKSINFFNPDTDRWEQHWVGSAGDIGINPNGEYKDGAMRFTRETKSKEGNTIMNHFDFYNLGPDKVRQHLETSTDNGATWKTSFDYTYIRKNG